MYNAIDVAYKMLKLASAQGIQLSNLQLQKLVYIAHGYYLGITGKPLLIEHVEAWRYGPVVNSIYSEFRNFGNRKISPVMEHRSDVDKDRDAEYILNGVLTLYGDLSAIQLVDLTHQKGTPWSSVWSEETSSSFSSDVIPNDLIKEHFERVLRNPQSVTGL